MHPNQDELERLNVEDPELQSPLQSPTDSERIHIQTRERARSMGTNEERGSEQKRQNRILVLLSIVTFVITFFTARGSSSLVLRGEDAGHGHDPLRTFAPRKTDAVILHFDDSQRYELNTEIGAQEWAALVPTGDTYEGVEGGMDDGHLVWLRGDDDDDDGEPEPYTVSLFHQLKCLDVIRQEYVSPVPLRSRSTSTSTSTSTSNSTNSNTKAWDWTPAPLTQHCMNYLRQSILCRPNLQLESVKRLYIQMTSRQYDVVCEDWEAVYEEAAGNRAAWEVWRAGRV